MGHERDVLAQQPPQHLVHVGHDGVDVQDLRGEHLAAAEREQLARELRGPEPGVLDLFDVLAPLVLGRGRVQQQLGAAEDGREEVVEVVRDATGELAHGLHLLGLAELLFELAARGHVAREHQAGRAARERERLRLDVHVDQRAVLAAVPVAAERPPVLPTQGFLEPRQLGRRADVPDGHREELLLRVAVAGHGGGVHRQEAQRLAVVDPHRFGVRLKQQAVAPLVLEQLLLGALPLDGHRDLGGHELEDVLLPFAVAHARRVRLGDEHADGAVSRLERDAEPVEGRGPDELDLTALLELLVQFGSGEQHLAGAQHVFGQALAESLRRKVRVELVDEVREAEQLSGGIVERDVEVPRRHQPAHDLMDRGEQVLEVAGGVGGLGDAVGGELDLLGSFALGDVAEEPDAASGRAGDPLRLRVALEDAAILEGEDVEARRLGPAV